MHHNTFQFREIAYIDPKTPLKKGTQGKKISMNNLEPFTKKIQSTTIASYNGGSKFTNGDTLLAKITPCLENGKTAFVDILEKNEVAFGSSEFIVLRAKNNTDPHYLYYLARSPLVRKKAIESMEGTSGRKRVSIEALKELYVPIPEEKEQHKISNFLKLLDKKIETNNRINSELEKILTTTYNYWFMQFDFPDDNGKPYKSSGGKLVYNRRLKREIPKNWSVGIAKDILEFNPPTKLKKGQKAKHIDMDSLPLTGFITKPAKSKCYNGGVKFINHDVLFARITPCLENGKTGLVTLLTRDEVGFGSTEFIVIRGRHDSLKAFAAQLSRSIPFRKFAIRNMTGTSGRKRVDAKILETYSLAIPDKNTLIKFEQRLEPLFAKMTTNAKENQQLSQLRDWLLPMLMNGQATVE